VQDNNNFSRRATDTGSQPTIADVWKISLEIRDRLAIVERQQAEHASAFPVNDLHKPDFDGHRRSHVSMSKNHEIVESYKNEATKKIIGIAVVFIIGLLSSGLISKLIPLIIK
jgi:hypothetical protein